MRWSLIIFMMLYIMGADMSKTTKKEYKKPTLEKSKNIVKVAAAAADPVASA